MLRAIWFRAHPLLLNLVVQLLFGGYGTFTASALQSSTISPLVFAFYRDTAAAIILLAIAWAVERRKPAEQRRLVPHAADFGWFFFLGLTGVYGLQGMSAMAVSMVPTTYYSLCTPLQPVSALLIALLVGNESFDRSRWSSWTKVSGIAVTVLGAVAMVALADMSHPSADGSSSVSSIVSRSTNFAAGSVFIALQVTSAGAYNVAQKPILARYPPLVVAAWGYVAGAILLLLSVIPCTTEPGAWAVPNRLVLAAITYACLACSVFNYACMAYINKVSSPVLLTAFNPLQGLFGAILASIVLGQPVGPPEYVGGALMVTGLLMTVVAKLNEQSAEGTDTAGTAGGIRSKGGHVPVPDTPGSDVWGSDDADEDDHDGEAEDVEFALDDDDNGAAVHGSADSGPRTHVRHVIQHNAAEDDESDHVRLNVRQPPG